MRSAFRDVGAYMNWYLPTGSAGPSWRVNSVTSPKWRIFGVWKLRRRGSFSTLIGKEVPDLVANDNLNVELSQPAK